MAAGAYKGLTIRIGADVTKLSSALRGANSVIFKTQQQLTKLNKAAKLDPGNGGVMTRQFGAVSNEVNDLAHKMSLLKTGMADLGLTGLEGASGNVGELARNTENAALEAEKALEVYNSLTAQLNELYKPIQQNTGINLHESVANGTFDEDITLLRQFGEITAEQEIHIRDLQQRWNEARDSLENYSNASKLGEMKNDLAATEAQLAAMSRTYAQMVMRNDITKMFSGLDNQLRIVNAATDTAKDKFSRLSSAAKIDPGNIGLAVDRIKAMQEALQNTQSKAELLKQKISTLKAAGVEESAKNIGNISRAFQDSQEGIAQAKAELDKYRESANATEEGVKELEQALREAEEAGKEVARVAEWQELETQLHEVNAEAKQLKDSLKLPELNVGAAAVQAAVAVGNIARDMGREVINSSRDVDSAYRDLRKTFDGTEAEYQTLYDSAMKFSQTNVTSADTMLEMEAIAAQLGVGLDGGAEAIQHFSEVAANLDVATDLDAETIALQMGQIVNVMDDLRPDNVERFGDALVKLGNNMPTQESNIMQISQRLSSVGNVVGLTTPQILGWAAAIASTGQRSEAAATGITNTITAIHSAVGRGGDDLELFASVAGQSADDFKAAWESDPSQALKSFIDGLKSAGDEAIVKLEDLGIEGVRQTQTLLGLAQTSDNVDKAISMAAEAFGDEAAGIAASGDAALEAGRKAQGFSGSMSKLENNVQILAASFGDALVPLIKTATGGIAGLTAVLNFLGPGFKAGIAGMGVLFTGLAVGVPIISSLKDSFGKLFAAIKGAGAIKAAKLSTEFGAIAAKIAAIGAAGVTATAAIGGLAAVVGGYYLVQMYKAYKHAKEFNDALSSVRGVTDGLHKDMLFGTDGIKDYADAWSAARADMDDFLRSTKDHADAMSSTRSETSMSIGMLEKYWSIIDKAIGAGDNYTGSIGELQWALDGLAEATGETYSAEDVLAGVFDGEAGSADRLREALEKLIETKKTESQLNALTDMRTEAVKGQMEAKEAIDQSAEAYRNYANIVRNAHKDMSDSEFVNYVANSKNHDAEYLRQLESDWSEAKQVYDEWGNKIQQIDKEYDGLIDKEAYATTAAYGEREGIMQTTQSMKDALDAVGMTDEGIKKLAQSIEDAGVSSRDFASISSDSFAAMVEQSGGDIGTLTQMISEYNSLPVEIKDAIVRYDGTEMVLANDDRIIWNGSEFVWKETGITVDTSSLPAAAENAEGVTQAQDEMHDTDVTAEVSGNAATSREPADNIAAVNTAAGNMTSVTVNDTANGNATDGSASSSIWDTVRAIKSLFSKTVTVTTNYVQNGTPGQSAAGAYIPPNKIPKHAAGIFTRPTLTNIGWVGEDGAELFSGNSLVPLTNRKYSMPYIDDISDAVAKKLGGLGTVNNYYVNDAIVNGDAEIQAAFLTLFDTLARKGAMNVG